jgi:fission process protein 1
MWPFGGSSDKPTGPATPQNEAPKPAQPHAADDVKKAAADFDPSKLPDRTKLPPKLQKIVEKTDKDENFFDELVEG